MEHKKIEISVVATIYKAEKVIHELVNQLTNSLALISSDYELILVEDGTFDKAWDLIEIEAQKDPRIKGVKLSRNFGQQIAVSAGLQFAKGEVVIVMDGDLQNPPEAIEKIYTKINEGFDVVYTVSKVRNNWQNEMSSKAFWYLMNDILSVNIIPNQLMMRGFSQKSLGIYNSYSERTRVVASITHDMGMKCTVLEVENLKRKVGRSNYNFFMRFHLMLDIVLVMTNQPLKYLINISFFAVFLTLAVGTWNLITYFINPDIPAGYTTLLVFVSFFGSMTLLVLGIIGRYLANIYTEVRQRPLFLVQKFLNIE